MELLLGLSAEDSFPRGSDKAGQGPRSGSRDLSPFYSSLLTLLYTLFFPLRPFGRCPIGLNMDNAIMAQNVKIIVGQRIRKLREKKGWSQEKLAEHADLDRTYIGRIERGEKNIGLENLVRIVKTLGTTAATLLRDLS